MNTRVLEYFFSESCCVVAAGKMMSGNGVEVTVHNLALEGDLEAICNK